MMTSSRNDPGNDFRIGTMFEQLQIVVYIVDTHHLQAKYIYRLDAVELRVSK